MLSFAEHKALSEKTNRTPEETKQLEALDAAKTATIKRVASEVYAKINKNRRR